MEPVAKVDGCANLKVYGVSALFVVDTLDRVMLVKLAGVSITTLIPVNNLSIKKPEDVNVSIVNVDTGSKDTGLVKIACIYI